MHERLSRTRPACAASARTPASTCEIIAVDRNPEALEHGDGGRREVGVEVEVRGEALFLEAGSVGDICGTYDELVELVALAARGAVRLTTTTNPLDGVDDALHALDGGRMIGRGVLAPDES